MSDDKVTTGEIYRRLCDMDERYEKTLDRIELQVQKTNGRTTTLEEGLRRADQELKRLNSAVFPRHAVNDAGETLSLKVSSKVWAAIAAGGGVLFAMAVETFKQWLARQ